MCVSSNLPTDMLRPRLLLRAARHGLQDYRRERDLRRLLPTDVQSTANALPRLIAAEAEAEATRCRGDAGYSISRHVELLIALLAEARLSAASVNA
jgi:hypothetical protein